MEKYPEDVDGKSESESEEGSIVVFPGKEKKKRGRKCTWDDVTINDLVDIILENVHGMML